MDRIAAIDITTDVLFFEVMRMVLRRVVGQARN